MAKYPHQLSGGQRQRVIIALALACGAEFLIADEPTRNLDVTIQASILKLLREVQLKHGMTVLFIANNLSLVSAFCDRVGILYGGRIIEENATAALIGAPREEYTRVLIDAVRTGHHERRSLATGEELLRVENLKKYFDINDELRHQKHLTLKAVDDVSFTLNRGEVLGIVGRERLRQEHARQHHTEPLRAHRGQGRLRRARRLRRGEKGRPRLPPQRADSLPGPLLVAEPALAH